MTTEPRFTELLPEPVLCYVSDSWAYFTTCPLEHQWGDDWNDAPYEHNAGNPYEWLPHNAPEPKWEIVRIAYDGHWLLPEGNGINSQFSVEHINRGAVAWLRTYDARVCIFAGVTMDEFSRLIASGGGRVYRSA